MFADRADLVQRSTDLLAIDATILEPAIEELEREGLVVVEPHGSDRAVYLKSLHVAEVGAATRLGALLATPASPLSIDVDKALAWFENQDHLVLADEQKDAIRKATVSKVLVVTGGPGTGKTTLVNGIIRILEKKGRRILLAAPTGRAAKRMAEATGHEAKTIHRLLEFSPKVMAFGRNADNPLDADLLVVDEASMIDTVLAYNLLKAVPPRCQLVLVGDVDQLPSVGPGSVLREVIASGVAEVVRLRHIFRQAHRSLIVVNAHRINRGYMPEGPPADDQAGANQDFFFVNRKEPEEILAALMHLVRERIPARFGLHPIDDVQILTPMHRGVLGATALNAELQAMLNPGGDSLTRGTRTFRVGDKVMQIRNNYDLEVYNGDIGRIRGIDPVEQEVQVVVDGRTVTYDYADLGELVLAYACSIHKSQGSEYPCVVIPLHTQHYMMLQRNLLYTGVTRGKRLVVVVGNKRALAIAIKNDTIEVRNTRLAEWLRAAARGRSHDDAEVCR
jgi:exodeoxyribonuclease V alpha subunit